MPHMNIAHHCALAIPGKFGIRAQKWNSLVSEPIQHGVADGLPTRLAFAQFRRSRNLETWRRQKSNVGNETRETNAFEQSTQIQTAACLKLKLVCRSSPNCAGAESAQVILQFALPDAQGLIGELACYRQFLRQIIAALPLPGLQRSFHSCILQLRDIAT